MRITLDDVVNCATTREIIDSLKFALDDDVSFDASFIIQFLRMGGYPELEQAILCYFDDEEFERRSQTQRDEIVQEESREFEAIFNKLFNGVV